MARKLIPLVIAAAALLLGAFRARADFPNLCCDSFDGTTAFNCKPVVWAPGMASQCSGVLLDLDCENLSASLQCGPPPVLGGSRNPGLNCRCVSTTSIRP